MSATEEFFRSSIERSAESNTPHGYIARKMLHWVDEVQSRDVHLGEIYDIVGLCILDGVVGFHNFCLFSARHNIEVSQKSMKEDFENGADITGLFIRERKTVNFNPTKTSLLLKC